MAAYEVFAFPLDHRVMTIGGLVVVGISGAKVLDHIAGLRVARFRVVTVRVVGLRPVEGAPHPRESVGFVNLLVTADTGDGIDVAEVGPGDEMR